MALDNGKTIAAMGNSVISANAYIGVAPIVEALKSGADVVITGRAADPAIFMAPLIVEFGWAMDNWTMLGRGVLVGHLLECAGQVTGGYFADPGAEGCRPISPGSASRLERSAKTESSSSPRSRVRAAQ